MIRKSKTIWYFPLEILKARYTEQLCKYWIPDAIKYYMDKNDKFKVIEGENISSDIKVGQVLDATGRGKYSLSQCSKFLEEIEKGNVKTGDVLYIQDYWTPGLEAIWYALDMYKIKLRIYSMCHAQSVDEYDFTYPMRNWMRKYELGLDRVSSGIFVASSIHKRQLRRAGFKAPIHVVSLPFGLNEVKKRMDKFPKNTENIVVFSSRFDWEKNPSFMMKVAEKFLEKHKDWKWYVTTSGKTLRSNNNKLVTQARKLAQKNKRFVIKEGITKDEYYEILCKSKIQFNSSIQDYVSWTLLEASLAQCELCYPNFRSFPECVPKQRLYVNQNIKSALKILDKCVNNPMLFSKVAYLSDLGRYIEADIIVNGRKTEFNIWKDG